MTKLIGEKPRRDNNFDFLRFTLATLVIFSHSFPLLRGSDLAEPLHRATRQQTFGDIAVDGFFILSGFLIATSYEHSKSLLDYARKRARRIYPAYLVALIVTAFIVGPFAAETASVPFQPHWLLRFLRAAVTLRGDYERYAFAHNPYPHTSNGSMWTIFWEVVCYGGVVVAGVTGILKRRRLLAGVMAIFATGWLLLLVFPDAIHHSLVLRKMPDMPRLFACFLAGMTAYAYRAEIPFSRGLVAAALVALLVGCLVPPGAAITIPLCGAYLLFAFGYSRRIRLYGWGRYGDFSYGIYLYAFPIEQLLVQRYPGLSPAELFAIAAPLSIVAGALSWYLVERRFLGARSKPPKVEPRSSEAAIAA